MSEPNGEDSTWNPALDERRTERRNGDSGTRADRKPESVELELFGHKAKFYGVNISDVMMLIMLGGIGSGSWFLGTQLERLAVAQEAMAHATRLAVCMGGGDRTQSLKDRHEDCARMLGDGKR